MKIIFLLISFYFIFLFLIVSLVMVVERSWILAISRLIITTPIALLASPSSGNK